MSNTESSDEHLKKYLESNDYREGGNIENNNNNDRKSNSENFSTQKDLEFISLDISELPCSPFYPAGTSVFVRAAKVQEIQAFSVVDDKNFYDIYEKVNSMVQSCVFIKLPNGERKPYSNLIDGDRWYLLFIIRELTFQRGNDLQINVKGLNIPLKRGYFEFHKMDEKLSNYYDHLSGRFVIPTKAGEIELAPPTLGLQKSFTDYMIEQVQGKKDLDQSFLKIIPYTMPGRTSITKEGIEKKLVEFKSMDIPKFQFLNSTVDKMLFGIKGVKINDENGVEVHSDDIFPEGISRLFVSSDAFDDFVI